MIASPSITRLPGQAALFALHCQRPETYPFLLESGVTDTATGRYSLLLTECDPDREHIWRAGDTDDLFNHLPRSLEDHPDKKGEVPFMGGWFCYFAYELAGRLLPHLHLPASSSQDLLGIAVYCGGAIIVDHHEQCTWIVSEAGETDRHRKALAAARQTAAPDLPVVDFAEEPAAHYEAHVRRTVDYIRAGDVYQANLARRWKNRHEMDARGMLGAYGRLRQRNAASFAASVQHPALSLASASPERLVLVDQGRIETRPIAGTRPRGSLPAEDQRLIEELRSHPKEIAEHIMLVDLERNDLGRICRGGSVEVTELLGLESYASVHHIVSNVVGQLRQNLSLRDLVAAVFPGGTITGCPKIRCMQIIAELEGRPRGAYTGSLGYVSNCGRMDLNILIRTLVLQDGVSQFDAGAGIVADSDPRRELLETRAKAAGLLRAFDS